MIEFKIVKYNFFSFFIAMRASLKAQHPIELQRSNKGYEDYLICFFDSNVTGDVPYGVSHRIYAINPFGVKEKNNNNNHKNSF